MLDSALMLQPFQMNLIPDYQVTVRVVGAGVKNPKRISYYVNFTLIERNALADLFA